MNRPSRQCPSRQLCHDGRSPCTASSPNYEGLYLTRGLFAGLYLVWAQNVALRLQKQIPSPFGPPHLKKWNNLLTRYSKESAPTHTWDLVPKPKTKRGISTHPNRRPCAKAKSSDPSKLVVGHVGGNHELARQGGCHLAVGSLSGESIFNFILIFNRPPARSRLPSILWHLWPLTLWPPPPNPCPTPLSLPLLLPPVITNSLSNSQRWEFRASFFL